MSSLSLYRKCFVIDDQTRDLDDQTRDLEPL